MPSFATPAPVSATIDLSVGHVQIIATDRQDTVVDVRPSTPSDESDREAAAATRVDCVDGVLTVRGPKGRMFDFSKKTRSVDVVVELPTGSRVQVDMSVGHCTSTGLLGDSKVRTSVGNVRIDRAGALRVDTSAGDVSADEISGTAEITTGSGTVRLGEIGGAAVAKNSNGSTEIGSVRGDLRVRNSNGDITVRHAAGGVDAKSAFGNVLVGEVVRGTVVLNTSFGGIEVGIAEGTTAWLDLKTGFGRVRNELTETGQGPSATEEKAEVTAHTSHGDITVRRS